MAGNSELLTIHDATWEGNGNAWEMQKCMCVSMNICCVKLTENLGLKSSVIIKLPWWLFRSVIPWFIT